MPRRGLQTRYTLSRGLMAGLYQQDATPLSVRQSLLNQETPVLPAATPNYKLDKDGYYEPRHHPICIGNQLNGFPRNSCGCTIYTPNFDLKLRLPENTSKSEEFSWVAAQGGNIPENAIVVGMECNKSLIYASRARHVTDEVYVEVVPAKLIGDLRRNASFAWGCEEIGSTDFEVLCGPAVVWKRASNGAMPDTAIPVGETSTGDILFMGRAPFLNTLTPGRVHPNPAGKYSLYIGRDGLEIIIKDFEVMCYDMTKDIQRNAVKKIEKLWLSKMYSPNSRYVRNVIQSRFEKALQKIANA